ncbi:MAG: DUF1840 domain-containing protein [Thiothrix sp.]
MIRFTSPHSASVSMFDKDAKTLIRLMGHSGTVPSAIRATDVASALQTLEAALQQQAATQQADNQNSTAAHHECTEKAVSLSVRAYPLLALLRSAVAKQQRVMWEEDRGFF